MRYPFLTPSCDAGARVVFEALAATVEVESRSERQALFPRYAGYYAWLSRLPRRLQRSCSRGRRSLKLSTWRDGLLVMLLVLATPLAYAQFPPPPPPPPPSGPSAGTISAIRVSNATTATTLTAMAARPLAKTSST